MHLKQFALKTIIKIDIQMKILIIVTYKRLKNNKKLKKNYHKSKECERIIWVRKDEAMVNYEPTLA